MSADAGSLHTICRVLFWVFRFDQILVIALYFALHFDQIPSCTQYRRNLFYFQASNGFQPFFNTDQLSWRPSELEQEGDRQCFNPRTRESATEVFRMPPGADDVSIHALVRVRLLNVYGLIINSATGVLRQPPMGGTKIPGREKEMIVVKIRTPTDYENRRCPGNFL